MPSIWLGSGKYQYLCHWFDSSGSQTPDLPHERLVLYRLKHCYSGAIANWMWFMEDHAILHTLLVPLFSAWLTALTSLLSFACCHTQLTCAVCQPLSTNQHLPLLSPCPSWLLRRSSPDSSLSLSTKSAIPPYFKLSSHPPLFLFFPFQGSVYCSFHELLDDCLFAVILCLSCCNKLVISSLWESLWSSD